MKPLSIIHILIAAALGAACATGGGETASPAPTPTAVEAAPVPEPTPTVRPDRAPLNYGPRSADGLQAILSTGDLGVGLNRFGFVMTSQRGFVTEPAAKLKTRHAPAGGEFGGAVQQADAIFQPWPYGNRGMYAAELDFDRPGTWKVEIAIDNPDGFPLSAELVFEVEATPSAPAVGDPAIPSVTRTLADVESLAELSTGSLQDEDLYRITLAQAVGNGKPTVVVFASPAFCANAVCGPQVETLQQLKDAHEGEANFVHVDFYDNPHEIQGDLDRARISPVVVEWSLPSIEWTFVIDAGGTITARFEGFATLAELETALQPLL